MIIPYAHESHTGRRWPLVTAGLIVVNLVCLLAFNAATGATVDQINAVASEALALRDTHPSVRDDCAPLARTWSRHPRPSGDEKTSVSASEMEEQQARYEALCATLKGVIADAPIYTFGYVPAKNNLAGLVTYQFVHAGWLHLVSNMWFLWLCGVNIEDRWGRAVYLPFYLSAGVVAALAQKLLATDAVTPIVGASGAIAGAMGAFLVLFARTRIRFAYLFLLRVGTFTAPALVMLPLWLVSEILWGTMQASGVAHWAHVGGFVYGAAFALVLRRTGLDARLDAAVDDTVTTNQDPRILRAGELIDAGAANDAMAILFSVAREKPRSIDAQMELLRAAKRANDPERQRAAYTKLIELYFDARLPDTAAELFVEMAGLGLHKELARGWTLRVAENLAARSLSQQADAAYEAAGHEGLVDLIAVRAALARAKILRQIGRREKAKELLTAARESPFSSAAMDAAIDAELAQLR